MSKQFLDGKSIIQLKKLKFDIRFIDEAHNGGYSTELSKKSLDLYGKNALTIFITATYLKPSNDFIIRS